MKAKSSVMIIVQIVAFFIAVIALFTGIPKSIEAGKKSAHDMKKIHIELKACSSKETNSDYLVILSFDIKNATGADIRTVGFQTEFRDKSGRTIGTVNAVLGDGQSLDLEKGKTVNESITLSYSSGGRNAEELFTELYQNGLNGVSAVCEVTNVWWTDGFTAYTND